MLKNIQVFEVFVYLGKLLYGMCVCLCLSPSPFRHRSPQYRVCPFSGTGSFLSHPGMESMHHSYCGSKPYTTDSSLNGREYKTFLNFSGVIFRTLVMGSTNHVTQ